MNRHLTRLDWQASQTMERIVADMTFDNFDQSMRFINVLINFLREEKAIAQAPQPPEAPTSEHEATEQGEVQDRPSEPIGADGQHPEQANAGSVR